MNIKRIHPDAVLPKYAKSGDSGFDLIATENMVIEPGETKLIKTGLAFEIPEGYEIQVRPRSGITLKTKLRVQLGTIDSNYRGEVGVIVDNIHPLETQLHTDGANWYSDPIYDENAIGVGGREVVTNKLHLAGTYLISKGDRIAQGVIATVGFTNFEEVDELSTTERGAQGYGSTGIK